MNRTRLATIGILILFAVIVASSSLFTVYQTGQALVLQFGEPIRVITQPGLKLKIPFIQDVVQYDNRVLDVDPPAEQLILADQKRLDVDCFARYRIVDPLRFYQSVGTEAVLEQRLNTIVVSSLRRVLGSVTVQAVLSRERDKVMAQIKQQVNDEATRFGIVIVDVRIRQADLPEETSQAIFARMRSEREREAAEFRAQGQEQAQQIRARAERERTVILAEAQRDAQILRGEGDNQASRIISDATAGDPQFYAFYRTLQAYRESFPRDTTTMVLTPTGEFFRYFADLSTAPGIGAAPALPAPGVGDAGSKPDPVSTPTVDKPVGDKPAAD
ncbi:MAG: protease modulator HflC [Azospirillaceae bacterium]|nr:protease modulator HflC [Azospirillaceae bacterium]